MAVADLITKRVLSRLMETDPLRVLTFPPTSITKSVRSVARALYPTATSFTSSERFRSIAQTQTGVKQILFEILSYFYALQAILNAKQFFKNFAKLGTRNEPGSDFRFRKVSTFRAGEVDAKYSFFVEALEWWIAQSSTGSFDVKKWLQLAELKGNMLYLERRIAILYPFCIHYYVGDEYKVFQNDDLSKWAHEYIEKTYDDYKKLSVQASQLEYAQDLHLSSNHAETWFNKLQKEYKDYFDQKIIPVSRDNFRMFDNVIKQIYIDFMKDYLFIYYSFECFEKAFFNDLSQSETNQNKQTVNYFGALYRSIFGNDEPFEDKKITNDMKILLNEILMIEDHKVLSGRIHPPAKQRDAKGLIDHFGLETKNDVEFLWKQFFALYKVKPNDEQLCTDRHFRNMEMKVLHELLPDNLPDNLDPVPAFPEDHKVAKLKAGERVKVIFVGRKGTALEDWALVEKVTGEKGFAPLTFLEEASRLQT